MTSIDDFAAQKDNIIEINTQISDMTEKISLMSMIGELLPDLKNINLRKKVEKTVQLSTQGAQLINQVDDLCSSSVDKFKKEYKELERKINRQFEELITEVTDKKWLTEYGGDIVDYKPRVDKLEAQVQQMMGYEDVLDINGEGNYESLYNLKSEFDLRYNLWKGLDDFGNLA
jgi:polyhydroxyalkanoate synthesis regulator phasin